MQGLPKGFKEFESKRLEEDPFCIVAETPQNPPTRGHTFTYDTPASEKDMHYISPTNPLLPLVLILLGKASGSIAKGNVHHPSGLEAHHDRGWGVDKGSRDKTIRNGLYRTSRYLPVGCSSWLPKNSKHGGGRTIIGDLGCLFWQPSRLSANTTPDQRASRTMEHITPPFTYEALGISQHDIHLVHLQPGNKS